MGHFFIAHGTNHRSVRKLATKARVVFATILEADPTHRIDLKDTVVLKFGRRCGRSTGLHRADGVRGWACGAGAWTFGARGPEDALCSLVAQDGFQPSMVDGSFAIAFADEATPGIQVMTDRIGTIHCYVAWNAENCLLSTSSLVLASLASSAWDPVSVAEFLGTGTVFEDRTLFREIRKLDRGSVYRFQAGGRTERRRYWDIGDVAFDAGSRVGTVTDLADALVDSVRMIGRKLGAPMVDLTGGYDSRVVLGAMLRSGVEFETVVNGTPDHSDVRAANAIAESFGLRHRHQTLSEAWRERWWQRAKEALTLCDGEYDILEYARTLEYHSRLAVPSGVSVNGSGGEFSKGYWWELLLPHVGSKGHFNVRRVASQRFATDSSSRGLLAQGPDENLVQHFAGVIERANQGLEQHRNTAQMDNVYLSLRMQRWQGRIASATNRIWPCVSPFFFREPLEIALSTPPRVRWGNRMSCQLIEHLDPRLAAMPLAQGYPALPIRLGTAHRFMPLLNEWATKAVRKGLMPLTRRVRPPGKPDHNPDLVYLLDDDEVRDHLDLASMRTRDLYDPDRLNAFLASTRYAPVEMQIGRVLTLERLARVVLDLRQTD